MVAREDPADVWAVVEADDGLAYQLGQHARHFLVLLYAKEYLIFIHIPAGLADIEQARRSMHRIGAASGSTSHSRFNLDGMWMGVMMIGAHRTTFVGNPSYLNSSVWRVALFVCHLYIFFNSFD